MRGRAFLCSVQRIRRFSASLTRPFVSRSRHAVLKNRKERCSLHLPGDLAVIQFQQQSYRRYKVSLPAFPFFLFRQKTKRKKEEEKEKRVIKHRGEERSKVAGLKMRVERAKKKKKNESGEEEKITQLKGILPPARVVMRAETRVNPSVRGHFLKRDTFATEQRENEKRPSRIFEFLRIFVTIKNGCVLF